MNKSTPDQATGMNELREALRPFHAHSCHSTQRWIKGMTEPFPCDCDVKQAEAFIQQLVERCLLEIENHHPTCRSVINIDDDYCDCGTLSHNLAVGRIRHNLQQAGLLRGDEG